MYSKYANEAGADAVIAVPLYMERAKLDLNWIRTYYKAISNAVDVPIFIQNHPMDIVLPPTFIARLVREIKHVEYVKEETGEFTGQSISALLKCCGNDVKGVFGGSHGKYMLDELWRGSWLYACV